MALTHSDIRTVRNIVHEETGDIRVEVGGLRVEVGGLRTEVSSLRTEVGSLTEKTTRLAVLQEEGNHTLRGLAEMINASLTQKKKVDNHDRRIDALEKQADDLKTAISKRK